jgi:hypothetical protein
MDKYPLTIVPLEALSAPTAPPVARAPNSVALRTLLARRDRSTAAVVDAALLIDATEGFVQAALHLRDHRVSEAVTRRILLTNKRR